MGTGRIVEDHDAIVAIGSSVAGRYQRADTESVSAAVEAQAGKRLGVIIDVGRVVTWDHTKLGGGY